MRKNNNYKKRNSNNGNARRNRNNKKNQNLTEKQPRRFNRENQNKKPTITKKDIKPINIGDIRLNKFISDSGICSRRDADRFIALGKVFVNGNVAGIGSKINSQAKVMVNGNEIQTYENKVYIALNKPVGIVCTTERHVKDNIVDFVSYPERIFPIGRLDKESEGLILLTNDGDIVNKILRSENDHEKEYFVKVNKKITENFIKKMRNGIPILNTVTKKCEVEKIDNHTFKIVLTQGLNRQIRRMCEHLGYEVTALKRVRIMNINLKNLPIGKWRFLTEKELKKLNSLTD